ncbi:PREDICTED: cysteine-rich receptor-like protein kinase 26 [Erythranthe guttata]|nr:PREDICTED: cysteine-rich receptor-like protein kinase 26 [Erythranthe guttata]|eukprot:XP_012841234.1 PREDICTED: cysteine-rich receptor-like protein kinase 26 [Erythranthe guttata]
MSYCKKWLPLILIIQMIIPMAVSQFEEFVCSTTGNYTTESLYRADLNGVLRSLSSNMNAGGFYSASVGRANVAALCRGDVQLNQCQGCVNIVSQTILVNCPNQFGAIMWSEFCMVRYSNESFLGRLSTSPARILYIGTNSTSPVRFRAAREELLDDVRARAADGGSLRKAAAGNTTGPDDQGIFTLLQCTPDLSAENCTRCLVEAAGYIQGYINDSTGIRVYTPSCIYRYVNQQFYNITRLQEPLVPASTPPSTAAAPPPGVLSLVPPPPSPGNYSLVEVFKLGI